MENTFIEEAIKLVSKAIQADNDGEFEKVGNVGTVVAFPSV